MTCKNGAWGQENTGKTARRLPESAVLLSSAYPMHSSITRPAIGLVLALGVLGWGCAGCFVYGKAPPTSTEAGFPGRDWPRVDPATQGLDPDRLRKAVRYLDDHGCADGARNLVIVRNGHRVWSGRGAGRLHGIFSCTKSFTGTVLGLLIDDGKCTLDTRAAEVLPDLAQDYREVTLRHFATMTSGYRARWDEPQDDYTNGPSMTPFVPASTPLFRPPGSGYAYWDSAMNAFARVLTRIAGEPLEDLFRRRIADPIGMRPAHWTWGKYGSLDGVPVNGGAGNHQGHVLITAQELARFGHLYLNRGRWKDRQLLSEKWVKEATAPQVPASHALKSAAFDGRGVYGYNWWTNGIGPSGTRKWPAAPAGTFAASGFNNNDMFVIPEWRMVVVRLGQDQNGCEISDETYGTFLSHLGRALLDPPRPPVPDPPETADAPARPAVAATPGAGADPHLPGLVRTGRIAQRDEGE